MASKLCGLTHIVCSEFDYEALCGFNTFLFQVRPVTLRNWRRATCSRCRQIAREEIKFDKDRGLKPKPDWIMERLPEPLHYIDSDIALLMVAEQRTYARPTPAKMLREERGFVWPNRK